MASHVAIAESQGPAKGYRTWLTRLGESSLPQAQAKLEEVLALPKDERLAFYCENVLKKGKGEAVKTRRSNDQRNDVREDSAREIVAKRITFPMAMVLKQAASKAGRTFEITDKVDKNSYLVKYDGKKITPAQASQIIGAYREAFPRKSK